MALLHATFTDYNNRPPSQHMRVSFTEGSLSSSSSFRVCNIKWLWFINIFFCFLPPSARICLPRHHPAVIWVTAIRKRCGYTQKWGSGLVENRYMLYNKYSQAAANLPTQPKVYNSSRLWMNAGAVRSQFPPPLCLVIFLLLPSRLLLCCSYYNHT